MHPLLQTLDLTAGAGTESSVHDLHPIQQAASARSHTLPTLLSLGLTPILVYALTLSLDSPLAAISRAVSAGRNSVTLLLEEPQGHRDLPVPARNLIGPEGPGGAGHRGGTSTLDPRLAVATTTTLATPSDAIDPEELSQSPRADLVSLSLNPALPVQAGGNGLARGTGRDSARGPGGLLRPPATVPVPDFRLVPTRQPILIHTLPASVYATGEAVRVRILIGEDGVPTQVLFLSGPAYLRDKALKTASEWRFEPLGPHGLKAPLPLTLTFQPRQSAAH